MGGSGARADRASDQRLLDWLASRDRGEPCASIAARWGVSEKTVSATLAKIRKDDALAHGAPWPRPAGRRR